MSHPADDEPVSGIFAGSGSFPTTHWSVVQAAGERTSPKAQAALEKLCRAYWYPLYAYVRHRGYSPHDAQDLTQSFFERLLKLDLLSGLRPAGARFRSFILHALKNLLATEWTRSHAYKRGGAQSILSWDELEPEARYALEPADSERPDAAFDRRWATTVLQAALNRLQREYQADGKATVFAALTNFLTSAEPVQRYAELAPQLGMTEAALKMTIHRLRRRFGELLRLEVAQTVVTAAEIDEELRYLRKVLAHA